MGQISGVNAASITSIAGVAVANISYVGPVSAATLGLGGDGSAKVFANGNWGGSGDTCTNGPATIITKGSTTLYYNSGNNTIYTDPTFETIFLGEGKYWYNRTDNQWWQINNEGGVIETGSC